MAKENKVEAAVTADEVFGGELTADEQRIVDNAADKILNDHITAEGLWDLKPGKPVYFEGNKYDVLNFDFSQLTGADSLNIEEEVETKYNKTVFNPAVSTEYLLLMAVRACKQKIDMETLKSMSLIDFNRVKNNARFFLLNYAG
ncbi:MAG: hypothetical protein NC299_08835 [Lachnospiraceae bacterium]|nr:hypothetical protein [Lachnospiraceae bacterium]